MGGVGRGGYPTLSNIIIQQVDYCHCKRKNYISIIIILLF